VRPAIAPLFEALHKVRLWCRQVRPFPRVNLCDIKFTFASLQHHLKLSEEKEVIRR
jgi:hypothetical protein